MVQIIQYVLDHDQPLYLSRGMGGEFRETVASYRFQKERLSNDSDLER